VIQIVTLSSAIVAASAHAIIENWDRKGLVRSIIYTIDDSSVLIDDKIVKEGDEIYGTEVVKIYPNKIEFERNGKFWIQRVCQRPNPAWDEPEMTTNKKL